ncbi:MAG: aspartate-alanine antiporter [Proteobacteria bacterium]|nr:aspartate-alanine antiporter [Pseudomonadota bacterium]
MDVLAATLRTHPEIAVFLAIGLGYWIGRFSVRGVGFGPVTGSLIAGLLVGYAVEVPVADTAKQLLFLLFMFGIGYSAGPGFVRGLRDAGWRWAVLGSVIPLAGLLTAWAMAKLLDLELGYAVGMMSGGLTESPVIGTASEAIRALPIPAEQKSRLMAQIPVADALTYLFGTIGVIVFCGYVGPWLLRVDLRADARRLEAAMGLSREADGVDSGWRMFAMRAYRLEPRHRVVGLPVAEAERSAAPARLFIERIRRDGEVIDAQPETVLRAGDVVAVIAARETMVRLLAGVAEEVHDRRLLDVPVATRDVVLSHASVVGRSVAELRAETTALRGVFLQAIRRAGRSLPVAPQTRLEQGDVITLHGLAPAVDRIASLAGEPARSPRGADFVALGLAIGAGALAGVLLSLPVAGLHIALGSSVAVLLVGLALGWRNAQHPGFAHIPAAAIEFMKSLGLSAFVAMIGLKAGPVFVDAIREIGLSVFLGGIVVTLVPQFVGLLVGRYLLRIEPLLLLGALAGAQTMTAALAAVQDRSDSPVAVIGYSSTVAFGHILISIGGTVLVWMLHAG